MNFILVNILKLCIEASVLCDLEICNFSMKYFYKLPIISINVAIKGLEKFSKLATSYIKSIFIRKDFAKAVDHAIPLHKTWFMYGNFVQI